ncbi:hypothetical protein FBU59_001474 [Linderina macrospora]|uniref:Uncharacterized protein n=1 Tax=Linderina macrospora TaxID=4868 RepID=A0ACC1JDS0_9FUNG|nr:hypothetical protein FBU59_001474 [Linderina macrospora]
MVYIACRGIMYDMDGTLVDTTVCVESAWKQKASQYGLDGDELIKHIHGRKCLETLREFFPPECHSEEFAKDFENEFVNVTEGIRAIPGTHDALSALSTDMWAVVTSASRMWAQTRMNQVGLPAPKVMIAADDVKKGKPDPEGFLAAAKALDISIEGFVVFEDAVNGVKAAIEAGCMVIGVVTTTTKEALLEAGCVYAINDLTEVKVVKRGCYLTIELDRSEPPSFPPRKRR